MAPPCLSTKHILKKQSKSRKHSKILPKRKGSPVVVAYAFNPSTQEAEAEAEAGRSLSSRPAWSTEQVPGQPGLHRKTLSWKTKNKKTKQNKTKQNKKRTRRRRKFKIVIMPQTGFQKTSLINSVFTDLL